MAISELPLLPRDTFPSGSWDDCDAWLKQCVSRSNDHSRAALVLGWYRRRPWSDAELLEILRVQEGYWGGSTGRELRAALGDLDPDD